MLPTISSADLENQIARLRNQIANAASPRNPVRGLNRTGAADYIGVSTTKFDELVKSQQMPPPIRIGGRVVWDIRELDDCFDALKEANQDQAKFDEDALLAGW
ncbi:MAG: hypothetical protein ABJE63_02030 [Lentilitoribacter sp.]